jgi:hypothetical protein
MSYGDITHAMENQNLSLEEAVGYCLLEGKYTKINTYNY